MADLTAMMQAAAGNAGGDANFIEDMFSCFLYTGNGSTQTINNGIDLAGEGGLVWTKCRSLAEAHMLFDTERGIYNRIFSNSTNAQSTSTNTLTAFNSDGFSIGDNNIFNTSGSTNVSWTFRKQPKFFDVVTYTGTGANRTVAHGLGSVPGAIWVKRTDASADWQCYHRSLANTQYMVLNSTAAVATGATRWNSTTPTDTVFSLGTDTTVNASGGTYVAYVYAHDAGGFGLSGEDNVISCGSFTTDGSGSALVGPNLGWEPQWVLLKNATSTGSGAWWMFDNMRGFTTNGGTRYLQANTADAENAFGGATVNITSTGFTIPSDAFASGQTFIYIAIRRGPMKVPETGTSVFAPILQTPATSGVKLTTGFPVDFLITGMRSGAGMPQYVEDRLRGINTTRNDSGTFPYLSTASDNGDVFLDWGRTQGYDNTGFFQRSLIGQNIVSWAFRRAPSVFDEVCYTGTGSVRTLSHNLTVIPELMIVKRRNDTRSWAVYAGPITATQALRINSANAATTETWWNSTAPTSSVFTLGSASVFGGIEVNLSGSTYVAYLFASCPGVSKVGSYTGTGTTQVINCGFTAGARFIMVKRTDGTGSWFVWNSASGIVAGNDPYLVLNSGSAEVTNTDFVDPASVGFEISSTAPAEINASGGTYIFLAIA